MEILISIYIYIYCYKCRQGEYYKVLHIDKFEDVVKIDPYANIKEQKAKKYEIPESKKKEIDSTWCHASQIEVHIYLHMSLSRKIRV
jgi:hypothetical protein